MKSKKTTYKCDCCGSQAGIIIIEDGELFEDGGDMYCYIAVCDEPQGYYCYDCNPANYIIDNNIETGTNFNFKLIND